ncbi:beclin 1-associated autophagy-related key regulator isoform X2 [Anoplophora glabripennis]|nr:beclin 1-associated autophagy-related key regulator isoform X2 [Anoplophora glabripennis]
MSVRKKIEQNCLKVLNSKLETDVLYSKIRRSKDRNRILMKVVEEKKQIISVNNLKLKDIKDRNEKRDRSLPRYEQKVQELENYAAGCKDEVEKWYGISNEKQNRIRKLVKLRIQQLFKYIFPIVEVKPLLEVEPGDDMVCALAEASQTTYIRDRWEYTDYSGEKQYCIVAPTLPSSGNYSAYSIWVSQGQDAALGSNTTHTVDHAPALTISAALTYTAQLVDILSFYLNVRLPHKMFYSDFCSNNMGEQQFIRRIARLNANILYMCFSQNVNPHSLNAYETIHNMLRLIQDENADLGRQGALEIAPEDVDALEEPLINDLKKSDVSFSEESDSFPIEWEAVPHIPEIAAEPTNVQSPQMTATQQASSMTGGLVNSAAASIASFWRGFTGGR